MKAGVIPFYRDNKGTIHMYFMVPSDPHYGGNEPQIAKGNIEKGETPRVGAMREGYEELGLRRDNVSTIIDCGKSKNPEIHIFVAEIIDPENFDKPHFETGSTHWLTWPKFKEKGRKLHTLIVAQAHRKMEKYYKEQENNE